MAEWWQSVIQNREIGGKLPSVDWSRFAELAFGGVMLSYFVGVGNMILATYGALAELVTKSAEFVATIPAAVEPALSSFGPVMTSAGRLVGSFGPVGGPLAVGIALIAVYVVLRGS